MVKNITSILYRIKNQIRRFCVDILPKNHLKNVTKIWKHTLYRVLQYNCHTFLQS